VPSESSSVPANASASVRAYLADVVEACEAAAPLVCSVVLFGSIATGSRLTAVSDVDLLFALNDGVRDDTRKRFGVAVHELEARHGLGKPRRDRRGGLERFADRITANERSFFICTRSDLVSGEPARILGIPQSQAAFVDRVAIPSIIGSGVVLWGEDLLDAVPLPPIRRLDVGKACFSLFSQVLFSAVAYPLLPDATKYAMDSLKRSVHNCYFCYEGRPASLEEEVAYLDRVQGSSATRGRLLELRSRYEPSFGFVLRSLVAITRQHAATARSVAFPREAGAGTRRRLPGATTTSIMEAPGRKPDMHE
jgi:predicted nucleotidyltransferase